jgi:hypothetical protein
MWRNKTIDHVDTSACNCWTFYFTDGTTWQIEVESAGMYGLQILTATEVMENDDAGA